MSQRKLAYTRLTTDSALIAKIPLDRWFGASAVDGTPAVPFAVMRISGTFRTTNGTGQRRLEVWVHDRKGDYNRIDDIIELVKARLDGAPEAADADSRIVCYDWINDSPDLFDDGYGTNCKMVNYTITGKK